MSYFTSLMNRGQEKANAIKAVAGNTTSKLSDSKVVKAAINLGDKALVNTVGIAAALTVPVAQSMWSKITKLAEPDAAVPVKK